MVRQPPKYLHHYTTAEGLISIVQNHQLWGTDILYMNDRKEFRYGIQLAMELLSSNEAEEQYGKDAREVAQVLENLEPRSMGIRLFVSCFSEDPDDLGQWRAYCSHSGYAIGFPYEDIDALQSNGAVFLTHCVYDEDEQHAVMREHVRERGKTLHTAVVDLLQESVRFKHAKFSCEKEWRLIHAAPLTCPNGSFAEYCFRPHNGRVVPYAKFNLANNVDWRRVKVTVGPCQDAEMQESLAAVRSLLGNVDRDDSDRVTSSVIPYRRL